MSYNIQTGRVVSEVRSDLPTLITEAKRTASADEHDQIDLTGQVLNFALDGLHDDDVVDVQAYGSNTPSTGGRVFAVNVNVRQVRSRPSAATPLRPWDPSQGPLVPRNPNAATRTADVGVGVGRPTGEPAAVPVPWPAVETGASNAGAAAAVPTPGGNTIDQSAVRAAAPGDVDTSVAATSPGNPAANPSGQTRGK